ncbi:MAG: tetratricopeptide repeat protein [Pseudomonadales bacterium]|nr:tetratricopeptide repeat protein [Pseudomonadales bacterium]
MSLSEKARVKPILLSMLLTLLSPGAFGFLINAEPNKKPTSSLSALDSLFSTTGLNDELEQVISLYQKNKKKRAKSLLIEMLMANPTDAQTLDVAGTIYLWEGRLKESQVAFEASLRQKIDPSIMAKLGVVRLRQGDKQKAERILLTALQKKPNSFLALRYLAWIAQTKSDINKAQHYLERLITLYEKESKTLSDNHLALAEMYDLGRDYEKSAALLQPFTKEIMTDETIGIPAAVLLINAYLELGLVNEASPLVAHLKTQKSTDTAALEIIELQLTGMRDGSSNANSLAQKLLKQYPAKSSLIRFKLARIYARNGEISLASKELELISKNFAKAKQVENLNDVLHDLTASLVQQNLNTKALDILSRYQKQFPKHAMIHYQLAELQFTTGRKKEAKTNLEKLIARHPKFIQAYLLSGHLAHTKGNLSLAKTHFTEAIKRNPNEIKGWINLAAVSAKQNSVNDAAQKILVEGLKANPKNARLMLELAINYETSGQKLVAITQYKKTIELYPTYLPALDNLASLLLDSETELKLAEQLAEKAYSLAANDPYIQVLYGRALTRSGKTQKAISLLTKAAKTITDNGVANYHLAMALRANKDNTSAQDELALALKKGVSQSIAKKIEEMN